MYEIGGDVGTLCHVAQMVCVYDAVYARVFV